MSAVPEQKLIQIVERWETLQGELASGPDQEVYVKLAREFSGLDPIVATINEMRAAQQESMELSEVAPIPQPGIDRGVPLNLEIYTKIFDKGKHLLVLLHKRTPRKAKLTKHKRIAAWS